MLRKATELKGSTIHATDGDIGSVATLYFDDEKWTIRYFVVDTGTWLGRSVLVSPISIREAGASERVLDVTLTRDQVENSPPIDIQRPVSRQHELVYAGYYGYPSYWGGPGLWGDGSYPGTLARAEAARGVNEELAERHARSSDSHLRDVTAVRGHHIQATDGEIGHVEDFLIDDRSWAIRYLIIDTSNWLGGRRVLVAPTWVESVSWNESRVQLNTTRRAVESSPEYDEGAEVERADEERLHAHYGAVAYWTADDGADDASRSDAGLARLDELADVEVADGEPDARGWSVVASDGAVIGKVEHLIVDRPAMKVRYLEIGLDATLTSGESRDVLIPIEAVDLDDTKEDVRLPAVPSARVPALPAFTGFPIDAAFERRLRDQLGTSAARDLGRHTW